MVSKEVESLRRIANAHRIPNSVVPGSDLLIMYVSREELCADKDGKNFVDSGTYVYDKLVNFIKWGNMGVCWTFSYNPERTVIAWNEEGRGLICVVDQEQGKRLYLNGKYA